MVLVHPAVQQDLPLFPFFPPKFAVHSVRSPLFAHVTGPQQAFARLGAVLEHEVERDVLDLLALVLSRSVARASLIAGLAHASSQRRVLSPALPARLLCLRMDVTLTFHSRIHCGYCVGNYL